MNKSLALHHVQVAVIEIAWQFREGVKLMNQSEEQQEHVVFWFLSSSSRTRARAV